MSEKVVVSKSEDNLLIKNVKLKCSDKHSKVNVSETIIKLKTMAYLPGTVKTDLAN